MTGGTGDIEACPEAAAKVAEGGSVTTGSDEATAAALCCAVATTVLLVAEVAFRVAGKALSTAVEGFLAAVTVELLAVPGLGLSGSGVPGLG